MNIEHAWITLRFHNHPRACVEANAPVTFCIFSKPMDFGPTILPEVISKHGFCFPSFQIVLRVIRAANGWLHPLRGCGVSIFAGKQTEMRVEQSKLPPIAQSGTSRVGRRSWVSLWLPEK
jgi:hypothetical protein